MNHEYEIDRAEVLRYLNCETEDEPTRALLDRCIGEITRAAQPRTLYRTFLLAQGTAEAVAFEGTGLKIPGSDMVGGAVLTEDYAQKIGADYYAQDARRSVAIAQEFFA